jgi:hypothetical protein
MAKTTQTRTLAELRQAVLDGEHVTEDEYARAKTLAELDQLQAEADRQAAARQAEAERLDAIRAIKTRVIEAEAAADNAADTDLITQAVTRMIRREHDRATVVRQARVDLARLGVTESTTVEGISWANAGMGIADRITIDGRPVTINPYPGRAIADALEQACQAAGATVHTLRPSIDVQQRRKPAVETDEAKRRNEQARQAALERIAKRNAEREAGRREGGFTR